MKTLNCIVAILAFAFVSFGSVVPVDAQGRWLGRESVDDFSGETSYTAVQVVQASRDSDGTVSMMIGCQNTGGSRNTTALLEMTEGIASDGSFQYRVDDSGVRDAEWYDGNEFVGAAGSVAVAFLREISGGRELRVRISRFREASVDATFNLDGMATHVSEIRRLCDDW